MGNLSSASYQNALTLLATLLLCGGIILTQARALNAMSMGEEYALHVGVSVRRVKLTVMICVSALAIAKQIPAPTIMAALRRGYD